MCVLREFGVNILSDGYESGHRHWRNNVLQIPMLCEYLSTWYLTVMRSDTVTDETTYYRFLCYVSICQHDIWRLWIRTPSLTKQRITDSYAMWVFVNMISDGYESGHCHWRNNVLQIPMLCEYLSTWYLTVMNQDTVTDDTTYYRFLCYVSICQHDIWRLWIRTLSLTKQRITDSYAMWVFVNMISDGYETGYRHRRNNLLQIPMLCKIEVPRDVRSSKGP